jgi:hypothetical protein
MTAQAETRCDAAAPLTFLVPAAFLTDGFLAETGFLAAALVPVAAFFVGVFLAPPAAVVVVMKEIKEETTKNKELLVSLSLPLLLVC